MFFNIIKKEILLNLVSFRFVISVILLFFLIVGSLQIMAINYSRRVDDYTSSKSTHDNDLRTTSNIMQYIAFGVTKDPTPPLLGIFAVGLEQKMSSSFMIPGYNIDSSRGQGGQDPLDSPQFFERFSELTGMEMEGSKYTNPVFSLFQPPDFVYIINVVLSLLAILFAYDCISGEKEDQTLKLMLSNSVPRDTVLFAKWIGGTISILVPFIVSFTIGVLLITMRSYGANHSVTIHFTGDAFQRLMLIFGVSAVYISVFFLIGMLFSTFTERPTTSLITALFAWVVLVLVIPNITPVIARQLKTVQPPEQILYQHEIDSRSLHQDLAKELEKAADNKDMTDDQLQSLRTTKQDALKEKVQSDEAFWKNNLDAQTSLAMNISRVSPSANFIYATTNIAGTGVDDFKNVKDEIFKYKEKIKSVAESDKKSPLHQSDSTKPFPPNVFIKMNMDKIPELNINRIPLKDSLDKAIIDIGILVIYMIALFMASFIGFLRYDVK